MEYKVACIIGDTEFNQEIIDSIDTILTKNYNYIVLRNPKLDGVTYLESNYTLNSMLLQKIRMSSVCVIPEIKRLTYRLINHLSYVAIAGVPLMMCDPYRKNLYEINVKTYVDKMISDMEAELTQLKSQVGTLSWEPNKSKDEEK